MAQLNGTGSSCQLKLNYVIWIRSCCALLYHRTVDVCVDSAMVQKCDDDEKMIKPYNDDDTISRSDDE